MEHPKEYINKPTANIQLSGKEVKSDSEVCRLCPTLGDPRDCRLSGSSVHGIFQAKVLEWGAICVLRQKQLIISKREKIQTDLKIPHSSTPCSTINENCLYCTVQYDNH